MKSLVKITIYVLVLCSYSTPKLFSQADTLTYGLISTIENYENNDIVLPALAELPIQSSTLNASFEIPVYRSTAAFTISTELRDQLMKLNVITGWDNVKKGYSTLPDPRPDSCAHFKHISGLLFEYQGSLENCGGYQSDLFLISSISPGQVPPISYESKLVLINHIKGRVLSGIILAERASIPPYTRLFSYSLLSNAGGCAKIGFIIEESATIDYDQDSGEDNRMALIFRLDETGRVRILKP